MLFFERTLPAVTPSGVVQSHRPTSTRQPLGQRPQLWQSGLGRFADTMVVALRSASVARGD